MPVNLKIEHYYNNKVQEIENIIKQLNDLEKSGCFGCLELRAIYKERDLLKDQLIRYQLIISSAEKANNAKKTA